MTPETDLFFSNLETPGELESIAADRFVVSGWACSAHGIDVVEIVVDGEPVIRVEPHGERPDVAAVHPTIEGSKRSGFSATVDFGVRSKAVHELLITIRDKAGRRHEHRRTLLTGNAILSAVDVPSEPRIAVSETCLIRGWTCSPHGITTVDVLIDGERVLAFVPDGDRPDVAATFPSVPDAGRSGFDITVPLGPLAQGEHELQLVIRDGAGHERRHERTLEIHANPYHRVLLAKQLTARERESLQASIEAAPHPPAFALWIDARSGGGVGATLRSIAAQTYASWTCHVVGSPDVHSSVDASLHEHARWDRSFAAIDDEVDDAEYVAFLAPGEQLLPDALLHLAAHLENLPASFVYSDHDVVDAGGVHSDPDHAPDWSPEHLFARNYVGEIFFVRHDLLRRHTFNPDEAAWRYDLLLRLTETAAPPTHVPRVLWSSPASVETTSARVEAEHRAVEAALRRRGVAGDVSTSPDAAVRRVRRHLATAPKVSIVIPTTGRLHLVQMLVESLTRLTSYPAYELVFIDNGRGSHVEGIEYLRSRGLRVLERPEPFNWARLNNIGARACDGDLLLFLNDDIEITDPSWLEELVSQAMVPDVGTVGALLLYPDGRIQHAGIFLVDHGGGARHYLQFIESRRGGYRHLDRVTREVTASTGACLMVRRDVFEKAGGFDEEFRIAFNDADFCMRLSVLGYRNLWTPHCRLVHHESISRKGTNIADDEQRVWRQWGAQLLAGDRFHNPHLTKDRGDCAIDTSVLHRPPSVPTPGSGDEPGVNLIGYIRAEMGLGEAARGLARAMDRAAVPFAILDYEHRNPARKGELSWVHRIVERPAYDVNLLCVNADLTPEACERLGPEVVDGRYTIGFWLWELPEFPERWQSSFAHVDEVWAPSEFVRQAISRTSTVPVTRIPIPIDKGPGPYYERPYFDLPGAPYLFLSMYDTHSVMERKNPEGAIAAFREAFLPSDPGVALVLKINNFDEGEGERLRALMGTHENIYVIDRILSRHEVDSLLVSCDCFVSLHRSEGFGLPIAEAMALGKPVIATYWSANVDFMDDTCAACVDFELRQIGRTLGPYDAEQYWAEPNLASAARWMRTLYSDRELARRLASAGQRRIRETLSDRAVGELVRTRLAQIRREQTGRPPVAR